jgi:arsenate reductase
MPIQIFHNPRCSKSRQTLELLKQRDIEPVIIDYLKTPPTEEELLALLVKLKISVRELIRTGEGIYKELNLGNSTLSDTQLIEALVANPILIQRPIVVNREKAAIGRPPENVLEIL